MKISSVLLAGAIAVAAGAVSASADVVAIDPFSGDLHEPLNFSSMMIVARLPIFDNHAALVSFDGHATAIHLLFGESLNGDHVTPRTGSLVLGYTSGPAYFEFNTPVRRFGGYWNNDSGVNDADVDFLDVNGNTIASRVATDPAPGNVWTWNGWESDVPISRIRVTGRGALNGFIWFDDMELSYVPGPGSAGLMGIGMAWLTRRRR